MKLVGRLLLMLSVVSTLLLVFAALDIWRVAQTHPAWPVWGLAASACIAGVLIGGRVALWTIKGRAR